MRVNPCHLRPSTVTGLEKSNVESQMMNYKQQSNSDLITVNYELKDGQNDSDLSVNEHPSVGDPDIQQHPEQHEVSKFQISRFQKKMRVTGQLYYHQMIKHMSWNRRY